MWPWHCMVMEQRTKVSYMRFVLCLYTCHKRCQSEGKRKVYTIGYCTEDPLYLEPARLVYHALLMHFGTLVLKGFPLGSTVFVIFELCHHQNSTRVSVLTVLIVGSTWLVNPLESVVRWCHSANTCVVTISSPWHLHCAVPGYAARLCPVPYQWGGRP